MMSPLRMMNEIEAKIEELATNGDPENTHNFTVELHNMVNQSLGLKNVIEENLEQEYEEKLRQKRVARIKALANCNRLYTSSAANTKRTLSNEEGKKKDKKKEIEVVSNRGEYNMSLVQSGAMNVSKIVIKNERDHFGFNSNIDVVKSGKVAGFNLEQDLMDGLNINIEKADLQNNSGHQRTSHFPSPSAADNNNYGFSSQSKRFINKGYKSSIFSTSHNSALQLRPLFDEDEKAKRLEQAQEKFQEFLKMWGNRIRLQEKMHRQQNQQQQVEKELVVKQKQGRGMVSIITEQETLENSAVASVNMKPINIKQAQNESDIKPQLYKEGNISTRMLRQSYFQKGIQLSNRNSSTARNKQSIEINGSQTKRMGTIEKSDKTGGGHHSSLNRGSDTQRTLSTLRRKPAQGQASQVSLRQKKKQQEMNDLIGSFGSQKLFGDVQVSQAVSTQSKRKSNIRQSKDMNPLDSQRGPPSDYIGYKSGEFKSIEHPSARGFSSTPFNMVIPVPTGAAPVSQTTKSARRSESVASKLQQMMKQRNQPQINDFQLFSHPPSTKHTRKPRGFNNSMNHKYETAQTPINPTYSETTKVLSSDTKALLTFSKLPQGIRNGTALSILHAMNNNAVNTQKSNNLRANAQSSYTNYTSQQPQSRFSHKNHI
ncbi:hypothetical protein FGO68_gene17396 [Halteria grandinella]|uniref:Uncharacterized protein n=1 Tax=Halteria grandinella TaxID=5974 RepID=A0A8J8NZW3_HALGN|nr:hypothetical protein FGO68_gene17396 [Halteria grandinella]